MADIFISYKKEDAGRVIRMVEALRAEGFDVWWDHGIKAGSEWDRSIHQELYSAKVVIAIWSKASVAAPWVKEEATVGKNRGVLVPVKIDEVDPPLGFMMIQAADLVGWRGDRADQRWSFFLEAVRGILRGGAGLATSAAPVEAAVRHKKKSAQSPMILAIAGAALLVGAGVGGFFVFGPKSTPVAVTPTQPGPTQPTTAPQTPAPAPTQVTENEQKMWDKAVEEKTRQAFQVYLLSYPNGAYAQRARDTLLTCRTETKEVWKAGPDVANQMLRGVSSGSQSGGVNETQLCAKAKTDVRTQAKLLCETIVTNGGYRNAKWTVADSPCDCQKPNNVVVNCIADLAYSCRWEMKMTERTEICG
jgi:TIR domain-containing protein